jgi:hypothetical protein
MTLRRWIAPSLAVLLLAACSGGGSETDPDETATTGGTVEGRSFVSDDARFTVALAGGPGVAVTIEAVDGPALPDDLELIGAYEVGPDGTSLAEPATISWNTGIASDGEGSPLVVAMVDHGEGFEELEDLVISDVAGEFVVTASVDGFSTFFAAIVSDSEGDVRVDVRFDPPSFTAAVGSSAEVRVRIEGFCPQCSVLEAPVSGPNFAPLKIVSVAKVSGSPGTDQVFALTCQAVGIETFHGSAYYVILPTESDSWGSNGIATILGTATCIDPADAPTRVSMNPVCSDASNVCSAVEFELTDDGTMLNIAYPDLESEPSLFFLNFATDDGSFTIQCRTFGEVKNCGVLNADQSLSEPFVDIGVSMEGGYPTFMLPVEPFVGLVGERDVSPADTYFTTETGSGEAVFSDEDRAEFRMTISRDW